MHTAAPYLDPEGEIFVRGPWKGDALDDVLDEDVDYVQGIADRDDLVESDRDAVDAALRSRKC